MAVFNDALDLQTAVVDHVGALDIIAVWPRLVQFAEANFNRRLRCNEQVTTATVTFTSGTAAMPTDVAEIIGLYAASGEEYVQQPLQNVRTTGSGDFYAVSGSNLIAYGGSGTRTLQYYAKIPTLSTGYTATNWLLTAYPMLYLYAVATEAAKFRKDAELASATNQLAEMEYGQIAAQDAAVRYSRSRVRVGGVTP